MNYDNIDLKFSNDGDFLIGDTGDLFGTEDDLIESLKQEISSQLKSDLGDWQSHPSLGTNLRYYVGKPNTRENAKEIEDMVKRALTRSGLVTRQATKVRVSARGINVVIIEIWIAAESTPWNSVVNGLPISFLFDSSDGNIIWSTTYQ